ncbi:MAG: GGDEF domain-containing protein, partial [Pseudomonadota bacterium]
HISGILKETVRRSDTVGRLGGEEFGVILPNANLENAEALASRIRERLEENSAVYRQKTIPCTVSIGVAERRGSDDGIEDIMRRADGAAYKAKQAGRNTVSVAEIDGGGLQMA